MRIGAIDVGTNSVHLLVADIHPDATYTVVETARSQVELGAGGLGTKILADDAFERGLRALCEFGVVCRSLGVDDITCAATSAVREAENGSTFCEAVQDQAGIHIRVIAGHDEARLIHLGARNHLDYSKGNVLLFDVGGGSTEFVLCNPEQALVQRSLPIGHIRATEQLVHSSPLSATDAKALQRWTQTQLRPLLAKVSPGDVHSLVGTSGTVRCLARMATLAGGATTPEHGDGMVLSREGLDQLVDNCQQLTAAGLVDLPGMDARRRRTLPAGAVIVQTIMHAFNVSSLRTSAYALRDGLVLDWIHKNRPEIEIMATEVDPRRRSVKAIMARFGVHQHHAHHVARLALNLFDATKSLHNLPHQARQTLEYAALLHDVGHHISGKKHPSHGQYLVRHTRMSGFTHPEIEVLAAIVRYHQGVSPSKGHAQFQALPLADRRMVRCLAGLLAIADGLDHGHNQHTHKVAVRMTDEGVVITGFTQDEGHLERWTCRTRARNLAKVLGKPVQVTMVQAEPPPP